MKKIGQGWQYTTYDLGNGKVFKKFHSWPKAYWVILKEIFPFNNDSFFEIPAFIREVKNKAKDSFELLKRKDIPGEWIANPKFINEYDFEQDKVTPLINVLNGNDVEKEKRIIDKFVDFNKKLINIGIIDKSFNITKNFGINNKEEIVLIDIGEVFDDKQLINKQLENHHWAKNHIAGCIKNEEVRSYFISEMDRNFHV